MRNAQRHADALTLIELLVVIAAIALLIAILLPSVRKARQAAMNVLCQSDLAQVAKGWQMYFDAHNGACLQGINANARYGGWWGFERWQNRPLNPYLGLPISVPLEAKEAAKVFRCPGDQGWTSEGSAIPLFDEKGTSYQTNILLIGQDQIESTSSIVGYVAPLHVEINKRLKRMNISRAVNPSRLVLIGDYGWANRWVWMSQRKTEWHDLPAYYMMAFLDGHASLVKVRKGMYITPEYRIQPFEDLDAMTYLIQREYP